MVFVLWLCVMLIHRVCKLACRVRIRSMVDRKEMAHMNADHTGWQHLDVPGDLTWNGKWKMINGTQNVAQPTVVYNADGYP
jgi:hypothetical protein